jgi:hypothetical protein
MERAREILDETKNPETYHIPDDPDDDLDVSTAYIRSKHRELGHKDLHIVDTESHGDHYGHYAGALDRLSTHVSSHRPNTGPDPERIDHVKIGNRHYLHYTGSGFHSISSSKEGMAHLKSQITAKDRRG